MEDPMLYVHYGTPLQNEEEFGRKKAKLAVEQGHARRLPPWKQEVTDGEGRRRFHGAFTGGFSAGYYNTVGSKEGWAPKSFSSSRKQRAEKTQQSINDFLDEDELEELKSKELGTSAEYDTFGFTATEVARRNAEKEVGSRPSAIPGPIPDELIVPATQSIGVKLLMKMGWRPGRGVGPSQIAASSDARREGRKATLALATSSQTDSQPKRVYGVQLPPDGLVSSCDHELENETLAEEEAALKIFQNTPVFAIHSKKDVYGLGFDPHQNAPEFKAIKQAQIKKENRIQMPGHRKEPWESAGRQNIFSSDATKMGTDTGVGRVLNFHDEEEDIYDTVVDVEELEDQDSNLPTVKKPPLGLSRKEDDCLPGFTLALYTSTSSHSARVPQTPIPQGTEVNMTFATSLDDEQNLLKVEPLDVQAPADPEMAKLIDGLATFVARSGKRFEDLSKEKHLGNPQFSFLFGGPGHDYYLRRLWEEQRSCTRQGKEVIQSQRNTMDAKLDATQRGAILGEVPLQKEQISLSSMTNSLDQGRLQAALSSNFTNSDIKAGDVNSLRSHFRADPAKQARFEKFLKEKWTGGLQRKNGEGLSLSRAQYEQEICAFENIAELIKAAEAKNSSAVTVPKEGFSELTAMMHSRFTAAMGDPLPLVQASEIDNANKQLSISTETTQYPLREESPWRPASFLCKRFNLLDPYAGKAAPMAKPLSQTELFLFNATSSGNSNKPGLTAEESSVPTSNAVNQDSMNKGLSQRLQVEPSPMGVIKEKPVDLYKAIFSDEDDDDEDPNENKLESSTLRVGVRPGDKEIITKQSEAAQAALNRLAAGDFLESLGKELGLRVPAVKTQVSANLHPAQHSSAWGNLGESGKVINNVNTVTNECDPEKVSTADVQARRLLHENRVTTREGADGREKGSLKACTEGLLDLEHHRGVKNIGDSMGNLASKTSENITKADLHKRKHATSRSSSSEQESESDSDSHKRVSKRSRKGRRTESVKDSKRHHKRHHERRKRRKEEKDVAGKSKRRHHRSKHNRSPSTSSLSSK